MNNSDLKNSYDSVSIYSNGRQAARKMAQLLELALERENADLFPKVDSAMSEIAKTEADLLNRPPLEVSKRSVLREFYSALLRSTEDEWQAFKKEIGLERMDQELKSKIKSGEEEVTVQNFASWVIPKEGVPGSKEVR